LLNGLAHSSLWISKKVLDEALCALDVLLEK
jgi:hypothetical protein